MRAVYGLHSFLRSQYNIQDCVSAHLAEHGKARVY